VRAKTFEMPRAAAQNISKVVVAKNISKVCQKYQFNFTKFSFHDDKIVRNPLVSTISEQLIFFVTID